MRRAAHAGALKNLTKRFKCGIFLTGSQVRRDKCFLRTLLPLARVAHQPIGLVHLALDSEHAGEYARNLGCKPRPQGFLGLGFCFSHMEES
jgi:hypothetical protein